MSKRAKILITIVCVLLVIIAIFGTALGIIIGKRNSNAVVKYGSVYFDTHTVNYLSSYYKYQFITAFKDEYNAYSDDLWEMEYRDGKTYSELLSEYTEEYIREVASANYLYDSYASFSDADKEKVKAVVEEILLYRADGDVDKFNGIALSHGFDYDSFENIVTVLYKASHVETKLFGEDGINIASSAELCAEYLNEYSHVKLLFIRTEDKFLIDENGDRIRDENNVDMTEPLTESEKLERTELIEKVRGMIDAFNKGSGEIMMSPDSFTYLITKNGDGDPLMTESGYYFSERSEFSLEFAGAFLDVVKKSLQMNENEYAEVEFNGGVCFIYKYKNSSEAYRESAVSACFTDFYAQAADYHFEKAIDEIKEDVEIRDAFYEIDLDSLAYNYLLVPRF